MQIERLRRVPAQLLFLSCLAASGAASADDFYSSYRMPHADWSLFAGANWTDNATLTPNGPNDTIATAGFGGSLYRDTPQFKADLDGVAYYEDYLSGTYGSNWLGNFRGLASYAFIPESFSWVAEDAFGQVNANPLLPTTPANRINGNFFSTGPDGYLRFSSDLGLTLGARYARSNFESNPYAQVDDQRLTGNLGLVKHLSQLTAISLNATASRVEYQVPGHPGFDQAEFFGRYESRSARSGLTLDAGTSKLRDSVTGSDVQDPVVRLSVFHRLTPSWNVNLSAGQQYQNTATALQSAVNSTQVVNGQVSPPSTRGPPTGAGGPTADVLLSQSPYQSQYLTLAFDFVRPRTTFDLHGRFERQRYQFAEAGSDRDLRGGGARFSRQLRPALSFYASADYESRAPLAGQPGDRTKYADIGLQWRLGSMLSATAAYHFEDRKTDSSGYPYIVNRLYLGVAYGPPKRGTSFQPPTQTAPGSSTPGP
jgi:hypothetical protein